MNDIDLALNSGADKVAINSALLGYKFLKDAVEFWLQAIVGSVVSRRHRYNWEILLIMQNIE